MTSSDSHDQHQDLDDSILDGAREEVNLLPKQQATRIAYAAAHIILRDEYALCPHSLDHPGSSAEIAPYIDWQATMNLRVHLDTLGFGIAEAMDTAQRFDLGWDLALRLIQECGALHLDNGFIAGAGIDNIPLMDRGKASDQDIVDAVVYQAKEIQDVGGDVILLPIVSLSQKKRNEEDYVRIYMRHH